MCSSPMSKGKQNPATCSDCTLVLSGQTALAEAIRSMCSLSPAKVVSPAWLRVLLTLPQPGRTRPGLGLTCSRCSLCSARGEGGQGM